MTDPLPRADSDVLVFDRSRGLDRLLEEQGLSRRDAIRELAKRHGLTRSELYRLFP